MDLLLAEGANGILYVEGETDFNLLKAWAKVLDHPLHKNWFEKKPFWHSNQGCNPKESRAHFFALRAITEETTTFTTTDSATTPIPRPNDCTRPCLRSLRIASNAIAADPTRIRIPSIDGKHSLW